MIKIFTPRDKEVVDTRVITVIGFCPKTVQLYILANDGLWYLQKPVGSLWGVFQGEVNLGVDGVSYKLCAVQTHERPNSPIKVLPNVPKSEELWICVNDRYPK